MKLNFQKLIKIIKSHKTTSQITFSSRSHMFNEDITVFEEGIRISSWVGSSRDKLKFVQFNNYNTFGEIMVAVCDMNHNYHTLHQKKYRINTKPPSDLTTYSLYDILQMIRECEDWGDKNENRSLTNS